MCFAIEEKNLLRLYFNLGIIDHCHIIADINLYFGCHGHHKINHFYLRSHECLIVFFSHVATHGHVCYVNIKDEPDTININ